MKTIIWSGLTRPRTLIAYTKKHFKHFLHFKQCIDQELQVLSKTRRRVVPWGMARMYYCSQSSRLDNSRSEKKNPVFNASSNTCKAKHRHWEQQSCDRS